VRPQGACQLSRPSPHRAAPASGIVTCDDSPTWTARAGHERLTELVEGALGTADREMLAHFYELKQRCNKRTGHEAKRAVRGGRLTQCRRGMLKVALVGKNPKSVRRNGRRIGGKLLRHAQSLR